MDYIPGIAPPDDETPEAWCFAFVQRDLLLPEDSPGLAPTGGFLLRALHGAAQARHYLGRLDGRDAWVLALPEPLPGWQATPLRAALVALGANERAPLAALAGRAAQLLEWDRSHRFCGVCATPTELQPGERARRCPACGHTAYPRLSPAMMALVWRPGELLLARAPHYQGNMYSALAGFVEAGESLEDCLHREVAEEVGVTVSDLRYFGSQSWPFPHSLMVAYTARWTGGEIVPQAGEIADARWFPLDALPTIPQPLSIAGHLIRDTVARLRQAGTP